MATQQEIFSLFDYEVQNRAMAYSVYAWMSAKDLEADSKRWYRACLSLEEITRDRYAPYVAKYGIDPAPRLRTKMTVLAAKVGYQFIPELTILKQALEQTIPYVDELKRLREIAEEDHEFFDFVVAQEELQVEMLKLRVDGKIEESAVVLETFVEQHSTGAAAALAAVN